MDLDVLLWQLQLASQEIRNLDSLVTLQLDNLSQVVVVNDVTVTGEVLLQYLQDLLQVVLVRYTLNSRQSLTTVTLLNTYVNVVGSLSLRIASVCKGVWG